MAVSKEVIQLEGGNDIRNKNNRSGSETNSHGKRSPYISDPKIVPRVKQYLEENRDKVYVDMDEMVTNLQQRYPDYARKKTAAFKLSVKRAFAVVLRNYGLDGPDSADSPEITDVDTDGEESVLNSSKGNDDIVNMYLQHAALKSLSAKSNDEKELIDLSSDDDGDNGITVEVYNNHTESPEKNNCVESSIPKVSKIAPKVNDTNNTVASQANDTPPDEKTQREPSQPLEEPKQATEKTRKRKRADVKEVNEQSTSKQNDSNHQRKRDIPFVTPSASFQDVGGCTAVLQEVCKLLVHIRHPEIYQRVGVSPPRGFLLHGPPGCGKTLLANAIAGELGVPLLKVAAPELVAGVSGESEERIRDLFDQAISLAPCVLFLDEVDAITPNRNNAQREMERRIVAQLLTCLDELGEKKGGNQVLVVGATNRPDSLDPALRRAGRFDREVCLGIPDRDARIHILKVVCGQMPLAPEVASDEGIQALASLTPGFVGADLAALAREAAMVAINRIFSELKDTQVPTPPCDSNSTDQDKMVTDQQEEKEEMEKSNLEAQPDNEEINQPVDKNNAECDNNAVPTPLQTSKNNDISEKENAADISCETVNIEEPEVITEHEVEPIIEEPDDTDPGIQVINSEVKVTQEDEIKCVDVEITELEDELTKLGNDGIVISEVEDIASGQEDVQVLLTVGEKRKDENCDNTNNPNKKLKTDDDLEVLEVNPGASDTIVENSTAASGNEGTEMAVDGEMPEDQETQQERQLELTKQLQSHPSWTPELCELILWLRNTPPLTAAQLDNLLITMADFHEALQHVQPSAKREGFVTVPDVTWDDVGSLTSIRNELQLAILAPVRYPDQFKQLGLTAPTGVLLCGPPGCGKTLLAKAVANEAGINFISVKGPELLNMYVGESEKAVRQVFQRARNSMPCVIFFDEIDALCPKRSESGDGGVSSRVVNQLLTEMDGVEGRSSVFIMAASNRPDIIDPAVLRPGRLDKVLFVGLPNAQDRTDILRAVTKSGTKPKLASDINLDELAQLPICEGFTGADLAALVREAGVRALRDFIVSGAEGNSSLVVEKKHLLDAVQTIRPSVTPKDRERYKILQQMYSSGKETEKMDIS